MPSTLGTYIRERRMELGLTQEALADRVGDSTRQADISRLEHNRVTLPRRTRLERIAQGLEVPLGSLMVASGWLEVDDLPELPKIFSFGPGIVASDDGKDQVARVSHSLEEVAELRKLTEDIARNLVEVERRMAALLGSLAIDQEATRSCNSGSDIQAD